MHCLLFSFLSGVSEMKRRQDDAFKQHLRDSAYDQHLEYVWKQGRSRYVQPWDRSPILNPCSAFPSLPAHHRFNAASGSAVLPTQAPVAKAGPPPKADVSGFAPPTAKGDRQALGSEVDRK